MKEFAAFIFGTAFLVAVVSVFSIVTDEHITQNRIALEMYRCWK